MGYFKIIIIFKIIFNLMFIFWGHLISFTGEKKVFFISLWKIGSGSIKFKSRVSTVKFLIIYKYVQLLISVIIIFSMIVGSFVKRVILNICFPVLLGNSVIMIFSVKQVLFSRYDFFAEIWNYFNNKNATYQ
jgi:hypothetical protein